MDSIKKIKNDKNEVVQEILSIYEGSGTTVNYSTTVFGSNYVEYKNSINRIVESTIYEKSKVKVWNSSLIFEESLNDNMFYISEKDKGVNFGWLMIGYLTKRPEVAIVVEFNEGTYTYKSTLFDKETKSFVNSETGSITTTKLNDLLNLILEKFNLDLDKYKLEPTVKKQD